jgi:hypothetical protein
MPLGVPVGVVRSCITGGGVLGTAGAAAGAAVGSDGSVFVAVDAANGDVCPVTVEDAVFESGVGPPRESRIRVPA